LTRIAATPDALTPITKPADGGGTSFGLLAVAAAALLALGLAALANTLRRTDDEDDLAALAWSDGLTGVANRRRLDRDIAAHVGATGPTAVIMVEVDDYKRANEVYGHHVGDHVLRAVGATLATHVRHDDVVYRYSDEEFCRALRTPRHVRSPTASSPRCARSCSPTVAGSPSRWAWPTAAPATSSARSRAPTAP
jgi:hypothetical protein